MSKLTIKSGQGELTLKKSQNLVGLKTTDPDKDAAQSDFVESEVFKNLGGFNVVTLKHDEQTLDDKLDEVRSLDEVAQGTHVYFAEGSQKPLIPTGELFITFHIGVTEPEQQIVLDEYRLELVERRDPVTIVARVTAQSPNPLKVAAALQNIAMVKSAEPDMDSPLDAYFSAPGDNLLPNEWHLENPGYVVDVNFKLKKGADAKVMDAWRRLGNMGSGQVTVALIDNGFDLTHPDLKDKVYKPYDVWANSSSILQGDTRYTHGTPCASVAIAASNGQGIVGAAPAARFMPVSGTSFSVRDTETMFDYCIKNGADIISCSWGTTDTSQRLNALKEAAIAKAAKEGRNGKGCVILFAAGNEDLDYLNFYAAHPDVIAVGATTSLDEHASYSNRGKELSVCAPSNGDG
ncbi:MAG TPA: S8 family serine peptidase, partial [Flavilitoribacter sp.]|nr:S8 family serine peptidase [Flavilitoribacter sp.]